MILFNYVSGTIQNLRINKSRNFLTVLGVAIGAACIATVLALTNGTRQLVSNDLAGYKNGTILVRPGRAEVNQGRILDLTVNNWASSSSLSNIDVSELQKLDQIQSVTPILPFSATITSNEHIIDKQLVVGTTSTLANTVNLEITHGQFISNNIVDNAAVLGENLARQLFSSTDCVGQTFTIRGRTFLVVGIVKQANFQPQTGGIDFSQTALISHSMARQVTNDSLEIKQINIELAEGANLENLQQKITAALANTHANEKNYQIIAKAKTQNGVDERYAELSQITLAVALVALLIGGIGVMNIMLVSVAEQTHEIGVRRSIGATTRNILGQYLTESIILSTLGGVGGLMLSYLLTFAFKSLLPFPAVYDWMVVSQVLLVTLIVGAAAGVIPALRAASKNPIEALRQF